MRVFPHSLIPPLFPTPPSDGLLSSRSRTAVDGKLQLDLPVYFAGCTRDHVCIAQPSEHIVRQFCSKGTVQLFETGHWVQLEAPEKLNRALLQWLEAAVGK